MPHYAMIKCKFTSGYISIGRLYKGYLNDLHEFLCKNLVQWLL